MYIKFNELFIFLYHFFCPFVSSKKIHPYNPQLTGHPRLTVAWARPFQEQNLQNKEEVGAKELPTSETGLCAFQKVDARGERVQYWCW